MVKHSVCESSSEQWDIRRSGYHAIIFLYELTECVSCYCSLLALCSYLRRFHVRPLAPVAEATLAILTPHPADSDYAGCGGVRVSGLGGTMTAIERSASSVSFALLSESRPYSKSVRRKEGPGSESAAQAR